jgi:hypothetical protein
MLTLNTGAGAAAGGVVSSQNAFEQTNNAHREIERISRCDIFAGELLDCF